MDLDLKDFDFHYFESKLQLQTVRKLQESIRCLEIEYAELMQKIKLLSWVRANQWHGKISTARLNIYTQVQQLPDSAFKEQLIRRLREMAQPEVKAYIRKLELMLDNIVKDKIAASRMSILSQVKND